MRGCCSSTAGGREDCFLIAGCGAGERAKLAHYDEVRISGKILTMRITSKGQVTIPKELRDRCRLFPHTEVEVLPDGEGVRIIPARSFPGRGQALVDHLRRHRQPNALSTDEIMALTRGDADTNDDPG